MEKQSSQKNNRRVVDQGPKALSVNKISLENLVYRQMKENLGRRIEEYVEQTKQSLNEVGPTKARKIILEVQKNLNKFMKGSFEDKGIFHLHSHARKREEGNLNNRSNNSIFNEKLLESQIRRVSSATTRRQSKGYLVKRLIQTSRKTYRKKNYENFLLEPKPEQRYTGKHRALKVNRNLFVIYS